MIESFSKNKSFMRQNKIFYSNDQQTAAENEMLTWQRWWKKLLNKQKILVLLESL